MALVESSNNLLTGNIVTIPDEDCSDNESVATCDIQVNYFEEDGKSEFYDFMESTPPENYIPKREFFTEEEEKALYDEYWNDKTEFFKNWSMPDFAIDDLNNYDLYCIAQHLWELAKKLKEETDAEIIKQICKEIHENIIEANVLKDFTFYDEDDEYYKDWYGEYNFSF